MISILFILALLTLRLYFLFQKSVIHFSVIEYGFSMY